MVMVSSWWRHNRAEKYFKPAVAAEPADGEAMRRYAMFLWHVRGDTGGAEDMFIGAIDEEPESSHIRSSYAWFLWMTGGVETCLIDNNGDDAE
jgi:Tfp pilus assembly protein PilF